MTDEPIQRQDKEPQDFSMVPEEYHIDATPKPCNHFFIRVTAVEVGCSHCANRWIDQGKFVLDNGKILHVIS